jgi:acetylornithine aminotransferase
VPIGACLAAGRAAGVFKPGNHGSTFGGNPLACGAALITLEVIEADGLMAHADKLGETIRSGLRSGLSGVSGFVEVRGDGLMIGIELDRPCTDLVKRGLEVGLLINVTADKVVRLLPPLIMSNAEGVELVAALVPLIKEFLEA